MSDTSYGIHFGLVCGSSSLQAGDSTRGLGESGVKERVLLLSPGSVAGVSLLLAGDTELSRSVCGLTTALLFIKACSSKKHLKLTKISSLSMLSMPTPLFHTLSISSLYCFFSCLLALVCDRNSSSSALQPASSILEPFYTCLTICAGLACRSTGPATTERRRRSTRICDLPFCCRG